MDWKVLLVYITGSVGQELLLRNEYVVPSPFSFPGRIARSRCQGLGPSVFNVRQTMQSGYEAFGSFLPSTDASG